jgi:hypothetical protein
VAHSPSGEGQDAGTPVDGGVRSSSGQGRSDEDGDLDSGTSSSTGNSATSTGDPELDSCRHFARATRRCFGPDDPSDVARLDARADATCKPHFALPGITYTAEDLDACARAMDTLQCAASELSECDFRGSLPADAPCILRAQCQSGSCIGSGDVPAGQDDFGGLNPPPGTCGKCAGVAAVGESCTKGECPRGAVCTGNQVVVSSGEPTCVPIVRGDVGAHCNGLWAPCNSGLYCGLDQNCRAFGKLADPCDNSQGIVCASSLTCIGKTCREPTGEGSSCESGDGCTSGLVCADDQICRRITWAEPNMPCDDVLTKCRTGNCSPDPPRACVPVLPDGSPCQSGDPCDTGSECLSASLVTDVVVDAGGVCASRSSAVCR